MEDKLAEEILSQCKEYNGEVLRKELKEKGYAVVPNVVPLEECDKYIEDYKRWLSRYEEYQSPFERKSIIQHYRVSHCEPTWKTRLWSKPVFDAVWETKKLLSSMDGIAIGEPPELGRTPFRNRSNWFHIDQGSWREGLHAYQGAVYLEETTEEDHCFRVIENTCNNHTQFFKAFPEAAEGSKARKDHYRLKKKYVDWYQINGGKEKIVPVPKGGMVLWDSRTIHDNIAPLEGRANPDRWRFVVFVSMAPAMWAKEKDIGLKRKAYNEMVGTAHWATQEVKLFSSTDNDRQCNKKKKIEAITELPSIAKSQAVKLLAGVEKYDFDDGKSNGPGWEPKWNVD